MVDSFEEIYLVFINSNYFSWLEKAKVKTESGKIREMIERYLADSSI